MTDHPVRHPREIHDARTFGQRTADRAAATIGSWPFLIVQSGLMVAWMAYNGFLATHLHLLVIDPFPWILLNLALSTQAGIAGPLILLSGNRQAEIDRAHAENAYHHVDLIDQKQDAQLQCLAAQDVVMERQHDEQLERLAAILARLDP